MLSLHAFLRDYIQFNYSVPEIVERYVEWVNVVTYMILSCWNGSKNEVFAVKCAKRGNDVYRSRVYRRFAGLSSRAENLVFFNPKDQGAKRTRALWVTLTYDTKRCSFGDAWRNVGIKFNRFMASARALMPYRTVVDPEKRKIEVLNQALKQEIIKELKNPPPGLPTLKREFILIPIIFEMVNRVNNEDYKSCN